MLLMFGMIPLAVSMFFGLLALFKKQIDPLYLTLCGIYPPSMYPEI